MNFPSSLLIASPVPMLHLFFADSGFVSLSCQTAIQLQLRTHIAHTIHELATAHE